MGVHPDPRMALLMELSDKPVRPEDIVPCPADCDQVTMHRHLSDGTVQTAYRGLGITDAGQVVHGPAIER